MYCNEVHIIGSLKSTFEKNASTHTCETTQLLRELKEDTACLCQLNNATFDEVSNENHFNIPSERNDKKFPNKSKQLIIYNEKGCMKGIEVDKGINTNDSSDLQNLHLFNSIPTQETYILIEEDVDYDSNDHSTNSQFQTNVSFNFEPKFKNDATETNTREILNFVPETYPQYTVKKTRKRKKKRGPKKGQPRKINSSSNTPGRKMQNDNQPSMPYGTLLQQQSYTQVSLEEVHLAKTKNPVGRPRRNTVTKTASEMLMLKRRIHKRIVQSTSYGYQSTNINKYHSGIDTENRFNSSQKSRTTAKNKQSSGKQVVRYRASRYPTALEKYGPDLLPSGWNSEVVTRKTGKSAGNFDVYFVTPEGKRMRSKADIATYIEENNLPFLPEEFIFRKSAYTKPMIECSKV